SRARGSGVWCASSSSLASCCRRTRRERTAAQGAYLGKRAIAVGVVASRRSLRERGERVQKILAAHVNLRQQLIRVFRAVRQFVDADRMALDGDAVLSPAAFFMS